MCSDTFCKAEIRGRGDEVGGDEVGVRKRGGRFDECGPPR